ncbi:cation/H(+) antiporter 14-like isoform X1 [Lotus japonicus]|uniref:cation/H(+) antiporter 14-like isoform X1 n=2 Tax=Lotus japonicus TaxID=34305 RepID=UPI00258B96DB|nr:cation/H(+) antiporter 14-like isoform X1 [Lotus japonicus]
MGDEMEHERLDELSSYGEIGDERLVCRYIEKHSTKGIFLGDNPLHHATSMIIIQIILIFIVGRITHFLLKPCHQTQLTSQIVAGIIMGPLLFGQYRSGYELLFPAASKLTLQTFAEFGMIIYCFKIGVQINPKHIFKFEKKATVIGLVGHISSILFGIVVFIIVQRSSSLKSEVSGVLRMIVLDALTAFSSISRLLSEINILNSEIGRVALSASMVSDASSWILFFLVRNSVKNVYQASFIPAVAMVVTVCYFISLFFLLRPLVIWISNRNPRGKPMTEGNFLLIMFILLFIGFSAQSVGQPSFIVAFWFGLILPDGPPLGSVLVERIDTIGSTLIIPAYCTISGMRTIVPPLSSQDACIVAVLLAGQIGKFAGTILPSLHFEIELWDSIALSLIMCCKGLIDLALYTLLFDSKDIGVLSFTLGIYTMVGVTGFATLVIYYIYDPSKKYKNYIRKSIKGSQQDLEFKVLVCVHNEENVHPLINLLQVSGPSKATPLSVFVLHLMELSGRAAPILTKNENTDKSHPNGDSSSQQINNVFDQFQQHNKGSVSLECFTTIAPFSSMHNDVCYIAMNTKCHVVIMPFHKQWSINGNVEISNASIRTLNQKVLSKSPCSVGVLIDRSQTSSKPLVFYENSLCEIAMIFLGGADDQDALAFSFKMAQHPNIRLTVFWVRVNMHHIQRNMKNPYIDVMEHIKYNPNLKGKVNFKEEIVEDGIGTTHVIRTMEGHFNLVIVGRHHIADSRCTLGLTEWCELPELGLIGNLLTSDFTFSVLVVQQQPFNLDI